MPLAVNCLAELGLGDARGQVQEHGGCAESTASRCDQGGARHTLGEEALRFRMWRLGTAVAEWCAGHYAILGTYCVPGGAVATRDAQVNHSCVLLACCTVAWL